MPYILIDDKNNIIDCLPDYVCRSIYLDDVSLFNSNERGFNGFLYINNQLVEKEKTKNKIPKIDRTITGSDLTDTMGYFGNIWFRKLYFKNKTDLHEGHKHKHDHISLLVKGSVSVEIEGEKTTKFIAPTVIIISKDKTHKITALEDDTQWWCMFAMRDFDGEITDLFNNDISPYNEIR